MINFYLTHNLDKCIDFSSELIEETGPILRPHDLADVKFSLATAYNLRGVESDLPSTLSLYDDCLVLCRDEQLPFIRNNLAMAHFFNFVASTRQIKDPKGAGMDALKPIVESFESCVENHKRSVSGFERFDFADLGSEGKDGAAQEVSLARVN